MEKGRGGARVEEREGGRESEGRKRGREKGKIRVPKEIIL